MVSFYYYATGKKKSSCARVFLQHTPNGGVITINNKELKEFGYDYCEFILKPLFLLDRVNDFSMKITVNGGGLSSQLHSIRHGISKALVVFEEDHITDVSKNINTFRKIFKKEKLLTRDSRVVERKKFGLKKARKKEQYSKR